MDEGAALEEGESDADEGFEEEAPASEPAALAQPQPVPLDHRLPEPVAHHEEVASPSEPARTEDSPNAPEE